MPEHYELHPITPQERFLQKAADSLKNGGLALCPTDAGYAFVWNLNAVEAENRVRQPPRAGGFPEAERARRRHRLPAPGATGTAARLLTCSKCAGCVPAWNISCYLA